MRNTKSSMRTLTKRDVAKRVSEKRDEKLPVVEDWVQDVFDSIRELLMTADPEVRLEVRDFGVFEVKVRAPRSAQNPKTLQRVMVPARKTVKFKAGREMRERLDGHAKPTSEPAQGLQIEIKGKRAGAST